ncbi:MAG: helix-turn-helix transcriptional regulator, partial [Oligoflexia bacterium]|nr:helix-turn-helix transcriptional regulator [Oligoflexia bacterium]
MVTPEERRGFEIRLQRLKRGWTLRELAAASGVSHSRISRIERGRVVS